MSEWASFSRRGDRAFYVQYAREGEHEGSPVPEVFQAVVASFEFGPTPSGEVSAERLAESLELHEDPQMGYRLLVPGLWPLIDRADDGSSSTFVEIGERGYLTVFARDGALGFAARDIIAAWKSEWEKEPGFQLIRDLHAAELDGRAGVGLEYSWREGDSAWTRRLVAAIDGDTLYAIAVDYVTPGFASRSDIFEAILTSFAILERADGREQDAAAAEEPSPGTTTPAEAQPEPAAPDSASPLQIETDGRRARLRSPPATIASSFSAGPSPAIDRAGRR